MLDRPTPIYNVTATSQSSSEVYKGQASVSLRKSPITTSEVHPNANSFSALSLKSGFRSVLRQGLATDQMSTVLSFLLITVGGPGPICDCWLDHHAIFILPDENHVLQTCKASVLPEYPLYLPHASSSR